MSQTIRAFIAVTIPPSPSLRGVLEQLATFGRAVKAVAPENLHLTLKFLGDTDTDLIGPIEGVLRTAAGPHRPFSMRVAGVGAFPRVERPSVIWAGLHGAEPLAQIAKLLDAQLGPLGFAPEDRPFRPHVTLARIKSKPPDELKSLVCAHESSDFGEAPVSAIELFQSELRPSGPIYTVLASVPLPQTE